MSAASAFRDEAHNVATGRPVEVLPGIHELRESLAPVFDTPDCWVSLWILVDPAGAEWPVLIDSGVPRSTETVILPALAALGFQPQDLAAVVNTHSHHDHAGSNVQLRSATGCQVWIHRADAPAIERGRHFGDEPVLPHRADRILHEGERVRLGGPRLRGGSHPRPQPRLDRPLRPRAPAVLRRRCPASAGHVHAGHRRRRRPRGLLPLAGHDGRARDRPPPAGPPLPPIHRQPRPPGVGGAALTSPSAGVSSTRSTRSCSSPSPLAAAPPPRPIWPTASAWPADMPEPAS